jgi:uncharacterized protein with GYD domain
MPHYLLQVTYSREAWERMKTSPGAGVCDHMIRPVVERHGGTYHNGWLAFGEYDSVVIMEMPDNRAAAAVSIDLTLQGAAKNIKTTPLVPTEVAREALMSI